MVLAKVALEVDIVDLLLSREVDGLSLQCHLLIVDLGSCVVLQTLDGVVELVLEHLQHHDWVANHLLGETRVDLTELIHVDVESV